MKRLFLFLIIMIGFAMLPVFGLEGKIDGKAVDTATYALDTIWVIVTAVLVMWMQAGFAMVESGFTRAKNAVNIMMKNMLDFCVGSLSYWLVGFGIMFGAGNALFGMSGFMVETSKVADYVALSWTSVPVMAAFLFQMVFAATAATIISGAVAERIKFSSYMLISIFVTTVIYPISGHWAWGGGWLSDLGFTDFAGSSVVHSVGGFSALAAAIILGPRIGKFRKDGHIGVFPGHNIPFATLGVFILWMGWYGFNPGSTMAADAGSIGAIAITTTLSAAAAALVAMFFTYFLYKKFDAGMTLNGALAGLVGITAGCANVTNVGAIIIGIICGFIVVLAVIFFDKIKIDDPVGAISVHGVCGSLGTILLGFLNSESGLFYAAEGGASYLGVQVLGAISIAAWAFVVSFIIIKIIDAIFKLRVSEEDEFNGLDLAEHGASAYADFNIRVTHG